MTGVGVGHLGSMWTLSREVTDLLRLSRFQACRYVMAQSVPTGRGCDNLMCLDVLVSCMVHAQLTDAYAFRLVSKNTRIIILVTKNALCTMPYVGLFAATEN